MIHSNVGPPYIQQSSVYPFNDPPLVNWPEFAIIDIATILTSKILLDHLFDYVCTVKCFRIALLVVCNILNVVRSDLTVISSESSISSPFGIENIGCSFENIESLIFEPVNEIECYPVFSQFIIFTSINVHRWHQTVHLTS